MFQPHLILSLLPGVKCFRHWLRFDGLRVSGLTNFGGLCCGLCLWCFFGALELTSTSYYVGGSEFRA